MKFPFVPQLQLLRRSIVSDTTSFQLPSSEKGSGCRPPLPPDHSTIFTQVDARSSVNRPMVPANVVLAQAFLLALLAYLASAAFLQLSYQRYFWFILALGNATAWMLRREAARFVGEPQPSAADREAPRSDQLAGPASQVAWVQSV